MVQKKDKIIGMAFLVVLSMSCVYVLSGSEGSNSRNSASVTWMWNDYNSAVEKEEKENKYILIDFWAVWCIECKEMDKEAFESLHVRNLLKDFVLLKVDVDEIPQVRSQFRVGGLPVLIVVTPDGEEVARAVGYQTPDEVQKFLEEVLHQQGL